MELGHVLCEVVLLWTNCFQERRVLIVKYVNNLLLLGDKSKIGLTAWGRAVGVGHEVS
jgi:hypothetical protein